MNELLSLRAAARRLGMKGHPRDCARRLMRYLLALEARDGSKLLVPAGGSGSGRRYLVAVEALRAARLLVLRDEIVDAVRTENAEVRGELAEVSARLEDVSDRGDLIADQLVELAARVQRVEARA